MEKMASETKLKSSNSFLSIDSKKEKISNKILSNR